MTEQKDNEENHVNTQMNSNNNWLIYIVPENEDVISVVSTILLHPCLING